MYNIYMSTISLSAVKSPDLSTPTKVVKTMCDRLEPNLSNPEKSFLDAGCGTGNFLIEVLRRRLKNLSPTEPKVLNLLTKLYGVDINQTYISETHARIRTELQNFFGTNYHHHYLFWPQVDNIISHNIFMANFIANSDKIIFTFWHQISDYNFKTSQKSMKQLIKVAEKI